MTRIAVNGIHLNLEEYGERGEPLLLLHGFTGSAATWESLAPRVAESGFQVMAVDLIGHGTSDAPTDAARYSMQHCVQDLLALLDACGIHHTAVLGYSMGGRVALHLAATAPERVRRLVVESGSPGLSTDSERASRRAADEHLANQILADGVEKFVEYWQSQPLFSSQQGLPAEVRAREQSLRRVNTAPGLANSLRGMGTGAQDSMWDQLASIDVPTLLVTGTLDSKFDAIARAMADAMRDARHVRIPDAGHAVHLERPDAFLAVVRPFLLEPNDIPPATQVSKQGVSS